MYRQLECNKRYVLLYFGNKDYYLFIYLFYYYCLADDTQLYVSFKPDGQVSHDAAMRAIEKCLVDIRSWMIHDRLLLKDEKTEMSFIQTQYQLNKLDHSI